MTQIEFDKIVAGEFLRGVRDGHAGIDNPPQHGITCSGTATRARRAYYAGIQVADDERVDEARLDAELADEADTCGY